jgi:coiled-coil domain-containing protein 130
VVVGGGRKRDTGEDKELQPGEIAIRPPGLRTKDPAEKDPFAKVEGKVTDKQRADTAASRILELQKRQNRDWDDPYEKSRRLRRTFHAEANREALKDKMSLGIDSVNETGEDRQRASMVDFGDDLYGIASHPVWAFQFFKSMVVRRARDLAISRLYTLSLFLTCLSLYPRILVPSHSIPH